MTTDKLIDGLRAGAGITTSGSRNTPIHDIVQKPFEETHGAPGDSVRKPIEEIHGAPNKTESPKADSEAGPDTASPTDKDHWVLKGDTIIRVQKVPRTTVYSPREEDGLPVPIDAIDVCRTTNAIFCEGGEDYIEDLWDGTLSNSVVMKTWIGETRFKRVNADPNSMLGGRQVRQQTSKRPDNIMPEDWIHMSKKARDKATAEWPASKESIRAARKKRGLLSADDLQVSDSKANCIGTPKQRGLDTREGAEPQLATDNFVQVATWAERHELSVSAMEEAIAEARETPAYAVPISLEEAVTKHREKDIDPYQHSLFSMGFVGVVKAMKLSECRHIPEAMKALQNEWDKLVAKGTWDVDSVREMSEVKQEARRLGTIVHFARLFEIMGMKGYELKKARVEWKARVVVQGNNMTDHESQAAVFQDLSSSASLMSASKLVDIIGMQPGYKVEQADAIQAFPQAELKGTPTWVIIPEHQRPASWKRFKVPVCRLRYALYGHPLAGAYWERHCDCRLKKYGFVKVQEWDSVYIHPVLKLILTVYVDDFKMAGPVVSMARGWELIRKELKIDALETIGNI